MPSITVEFELHEFIAYTYFAGTKTGKKYLFESGKLATSYAAKQLRLTQKTFVSPPVRAGKTIAGIAAKRGTAALVTSAPTIGALVVGGLAFNAIGNTRANQQVGHIGNVGALGMGGTF